jgi:hypothetical protein
VRYDYILSQYPQAEIWSGALRARLYLPDPERGYYRGTRFDWSGVVSSLQHRGHEYFGLWYEHHDPKRHDGITGPAEEFAADGAALGYAEAEPGGTFIKMGVGVLRKPEESVYQPFSTYEIVDAGKWTAHTAPNQIEFVHALAAPAGGYAYLYRKTVLLMNDKPELVLEHSLSNTGRRPIETAQYNHNFFVIDGRHVGPDVAITFPFEPRPTMDLKGLAQVRSNQLVYLRELRQDEFIWTLLEGFGATAEDYDLRIENRGAGAGVRITGDRPLSKVVFWSIRTVACPEPYVQLRIEPGREERWRVSYEFYDLPKR